MGDNRRMAQQSPSEPKGEAEGAPDPVLSVVIPVYNGALYLSDLIASLLAQQRVSDEVTFVDDGSTNSSAAMIAWLGAGLDGLRVIGQKNRGQAVARNVGVRHARDFVNGGCT